MAWSDIVDAAPLSARRAAEVVASLALTPNVCDESVVAALCEGLETTCAEGIDVAAIRRSLARGELMRAFGRVERALIALGVE